MEVVVNSLSETEVGQILLIKDTTNITNEYLNAFKLKLEVTDKQKQECDELLVMAESRKYHQVTEMSVEFLKSINVVPEKVRFVMCVLKPIQTRMNLLKLVSILQDISDSLDTTDALKLLFHFNKAVKTEVEPYLMLQTIQAYHLCKFNKLKECESELDAVNAHITKTFGVNVIVLGSYHRSCAALHKVKKNHAMFYKQALLYFAYTKLNTIPNDIRVIWAYEISLAALVADGMFDFGELLQQPLLTCLKDTPQEWVLELLNAFNDSCLETFHQTLQKHKNAINNTPELSMNEITLIQKMTLMAFVELAFRKTKEKKLNFQEITNHCHVPVHEVELLLMKAMAFKLVKGSIDEVEQTVRITWVKPRILDKKRLSIMSSRLNSWAQSGKEILGYLEQLTPELVVS